jgi:hypothetical protein
MIAHAIQSVEHGIFTHEGFEMMPIRKQVLPISSFTALAGLHRKDDGRGGVCVRFPSDRGWRVKPQIMSKFNF